MIDWLLLGLRLILFALLLHAAFGDVRRYIIPNRLCSAVALLGLLHLGLRASEAGPDWLSLIGVQGALAMGVFLVFTLLFALGAMGGGDVKLLGALALWPDASALLDILWVMALTGGLLSALILVRRRLRPESSLQVPYGVAIAMGGCLWIAEPILNQFAA